MEDALKNEQVVLQSTVLESSVAVSWELLAEHSNKLIMVLKWLIKGPVAESLDLPPLKAVAGYLDYYKLHLALLATVLASIKRAEPIGDHIAELQRTVDSYIGETESVCNRLRTDVPQRPWTNMNPAALVMLAPVLAQDQRFVMAWNSHLATYKALVRASAEVTDYLVQQGRGIEQGGRQQADELRAEVDALEARNGLDLVLKYRYRQHIDSISLQVGHRVTRARVAAESVGREMRLALAEAQKVQDLR